MSIVGMFEKPYGVGYKVYTGTVSVTGTKAISTGFSTVVSVSLTVETTSTTKVYIPRVDSISGGTVTVKVADYDGTTLNVTSSDTVTVHVVIVGY